MSKELEALNKIQHDFGQLKGQELVSCYETIFNALQRLEAIDNAKPSEALECLYHIIKDDFNMLITTYPPQPAYNGVTKGEMFNKIEQALLKEQEQKQYLKWEDLEFNYGTKEQKVKMGDTIYKIFYSNYDNTKGVQLLSEDEKLLYFSFVGKYKDNVQLFNDLHLEVVE